MDTERTKRSVWTWEATGAVFGFAGGILAALLGGLLTASTWILGAEPHPWLQKGGTALLFSRIPLLIFAGYCLDWMEREPKQPTGNGTRTAERGSIRVSRVIAIGGLLGVLSVGAVKVRAQQLSQTGRESAVSLQA